MKTLILAAFTLIGTAAFAQTNDPVKDKDADQNLKKDVKLYVVKKRLTKGPNIEVKRLNPAIKQAVIKRKLKKAPQRIYIREELHKK